MAAVGNSLLRSLQILCLPFLLLVCFTSSQQCPPYNFTFHFGDGVTDIGNAVLIRPGGEKLAAAKLPYGITFPGYATGRWSDGRTDFDYAAPQAGYPIITPYLAGNPSNAVIFSVARSPVLDRSFFKARGIKIPPTTVSLRGQLEWFEEYLGNETKTKKERFNRVKNSIILLGDVEANDVVYALLQGKTIDDINSSYVPPIIEEQVKTIRVLVKLGCTFFVIPGSTPIGCYPPILTALQTNEPDAYDEYGCLKSVNELIDSKNNLLQKAVANLTAEFPSITFAYSPFGDGVFQYLKDYVGIKKMDTCCGIGGKYNYNSSMFCGSPGVPVCSNPSDYMFWDGMHFTQETTKIIEGILFAGPSCLAPAPAPATASAPAPATAPTPASVPAPTTSIVASI